MGPVFADGTSTCWPVSARRSTPLATRALKIEKSVLGDRAGIVGAAIRVSEWLISPQVVDEALASDGAFGRR